MRHLQRAFSVTPNFFPGLSSLPFLFFFPCYWDAFSGTINTIGDNTLKPFLQRSAHLKRFGAHTQTHKQARVYAHIFAHPLKCTHVHIHLYHELSLCHLILQLAPHGFSYSFLLCVRLPVDPSCQLFLELLSRSNCWEAQALWT